VEEGEKVGSKGGQRNTYSGTVRWKGKARGTLMNVVGEDTPQVAVTAAEDSMEWLGLAWSILTRPKMKRKERV